MGRFAVERKPTAIPVVAAALWDDAGRLLLQQSLPHKRHAGLWEFPGGKVEKGENQRDALCREIAEELGIDLSKGDLDLIESASEAASSGQAAIVLFLYNCVEWRGEPRGREGQAWGWFTLDEANQLALPPMDRALLAKLCSKG